MPLVTVGRVICSALVVLVVAGPAMASDQGGYQQRPRLRAVTRTLPLDVRYRDPRCMPPRRRARGFGAPDFLIHGYLPQTTEAPMYNEPPSRFPVR